MHGSRAQSTGKQGMMNKNMVIGQGSEETGKHRGKEARVTT